MNVRVNLTTPITDGTEVVFRSPVDCSQVTGLVVYYDGGSKEFAFADAHGNNVGDIDHLFAENVVVKVILDVTTGMAFVQNADTNAYIERTFVKTVNGIAPDENGNVEIEAGGGVSDAEKALILSLFKNTAYTADMSATFAQLAELWGIEVPDEPDIPDEPDVPVVTLTSISATYSGGDVPVGTAVTDLTGIVVTAHYSDGTSKAVTGYTLSGTIAEGSNTITVSYGGKSTTFAVIGVAEEETKEKDISWDDGDGIKLTADDLMVGYQLRHSAAGEYYNESNSRVSYVNFDIPIEYGYIYTFNFVSAVSTVNIGTQFYNETAKSNYEKGAVMGDANRYDPGWQQNGTQIQVPELINGSPIAGVRLTFRKDASNSVVYAGMIESVTITRQAVG